MNIVSQQFAAVYHFHPSLLFEGTARDIKPINAYSITERLLINRFCSKLMCSFTRGKVTDNYNKTLAYYKICPFTAHYEFIMFYRISHCSKLLVLHADKRLGWN
jgi:hypothetical protein